MYEYFVKRKIDIPYIHEYWSRFFNRQIHWEHVYFFIHKTLLDNRVKQFRFKRIHRIIANNENLFKWKIFGNPLCHHCSEVDSMSHFLVECKYLDPFWSNVVYAFKQCGINKSVRNLFHLIIGYNIDLPSC